ncbi:GNAT family N-acetyltransferase [Paenibacillus ihbetae]|uniref:GNAT family N-acetyltransferase n=1 Tax=Paenibacillus ihbetae TaxID=1870820 RepID=UPI003AAC448F
MSAADFAFYYELVQKGALNASEICVEVSDYGEPRGLIGLEGFKIVMLFVDPDEFGQGIGTSLIRHAEALKGSVLQVDVNEQNELKWEEIP